MLNRIWFGISDLYAIKQFMHLSGMQLTDFVCILTVCDSKLYIFDCFTAANIKRFTHFEIQNKNDLQSTAFWFYPAQSLQHLGGEKIHGII